MAWVAIFSLVGLGLCGLWAWADQLNERRVSSAKRGEGADGRAARRRFPQLAVRIAILCAGCALVGAAAFIVAINEIGR